MSSVSHVARAASLGYLGNVHVPKLLVPGPEGPRGDGGIERREGTAPSTAATAAPAAEVPLSQFNTLYQYSIHWWLHAQRHRR